MKTAISLPDETFYRVDDAAARMGVSRSEFFVRAVEQMPARLETDDVTTAIDAVLETQEETADPFVMRAARVAFTGTSET